jgi:hypothetical protein
VVGKVGAPLVMVEKIDVEILSANSALLGKNKRSPPFEIYQQGKDFGIYEQEVGIT